MVMRRGKARQGIRGEAARLPHDPAGIVITMGTRSCPREGFSGAGFRAPSTRQNGTTTRVVAGARPLPSSVTPSAMRSRSRAAVPRPTGSDAAVTAAVKARVAADYRGRLTRVAVTLRLSLSATARPPSTPRPIDWMRGVAIRFSTRYRRTADTRRWLSSTL
jgi:hypothetical protein